MNFGPGEVICTDCEGRFQFRDEDADAFCEKHGITVLLTSGKRFKTWSRAKGQQTPSISSLEEQGFERMWMFCTQEIHTRGVEIHI